MLWGKRRRKHIYIIGDVHGQYEKLVGLLRAAGLIDSQLSWSGGDTQLWFMGDFLDRGPRGVECIELVMRLQREAAAVGGEVHSLLGNHEALFLGAYKFGRHRVDSIFALGWLRNGGVKEDMSRITDTHLDWLKALPAMALVQDRLLMHADATFYTQYGDSIEAVNENICQLLNSSAPQGWDQFLDAFSERMTFFQPSNGVDTAAGMLRQYGGQQIIHGHTPIHYMQTDLKPADIHEPLTYAHNLCANMDGAMSLGGSGFVYRLSL